MQETLYAHPDLWVILFFLIAGGVGSGTGFLVGRSFWRLLARKTSLPLARVLSILWFVFWSAAISISLFAAITAALELGGINASDFLEHTSNWSMWMLLLPLLLWGWVLWRALRIPEVPSPLQGLHALWRAVWVPLLLFCIAFGLFVALRTPTLQKQQQATEVVAQIEAQKITLDEVMGKDLPPPPDPAKVDATVAGVDANANGIRDDVELAIFKLHPDSARIRAAELQYALTEQMFLTQVFDQMTWKAVAEQDDRAFQCLSSVGRNKDYPKEVKNLVLNTKVRIEKYNNVFNFITSFGLPDSQTCDIDLDKLPN